MLEKIVIEVVRNFVVLHYFPGFIFIFERAFKEVERTIVLVVDQILEVVLEGDAQFVAIIILSNFEFEIFVVPIEILMSPLLSHVPAIRAAYMEYTIPLMITGLLVF